ncbi:MAG: hypothetical protein KFKLKKLM_02271 [Flavobacteriales bacterium]|nr:hypothetical protein [Flavobacteriales bacterium]
MLRRNILLGVLFVICLVANAQQSKINLQLKHTLKQSKPDDVIALFVRGDVPKIKQTVEAFGGKVKLSAKDVVQVELPSSTIEFFSKNDFVKSIEYSFFKGEILNDTMIIQNNVVPAHLGEFPIKEPYTGKGIVTGFIDTGIDIFHPDFKDSLGNTRILAIWDQYNADNGSSAYGYGEVWDSSAINSGNCSHIDHSNTNHGTHVAGVAAGNGRAVNNYKGVAPESNVVMVASKENVSNWLSTVVDAVNFIYDVADFYEMPCVINVSMGTYWGSHDATDAASLLIDSIVNYKEGRAFVCAAGNAGHLKWHVEHQITSDTSFTWFQYNPSSAFGFGAVYFEAWADTADLNQVQYAIGANLPSGTYDLRGSTPFVNIQNRLGNFTDTIYNDTNRIAIVETYAELQGDKYLLQVMLQEPDSNSYNFSLMTTGLGRLDIWSASWLGVSNMIESSLPTTTEFPAIVNYQKPDSAKTMVSSFQNLSSILTVGNFNNRATYLDVDSIVRSTGRIPGSKAPSSSWGPTRRGNMKPDVAATGDESIGPVSAAVVAANLASTPANRAKIAFGGYHRKNGGTSMASPVVAGVSALYLQKCPSASMSEIKNAIINTAKQDTFTGAVPNIGFGYGKVNAFEALNYSNFNFSLGNDFHLCDNEVVSVNPTGNYQTYLWSTNDTTPSIAVDTSKTIYLEVANASGCKGWSDTIQSFWHTLPPKPILTLIGNDTLIYSSNDSLQWYFNSSIITNETDTFLIAQNNGDYFLTVIDSFSCVNYSDTITILTIGTENLKENNEEVLIYPNPANQQLFIQLQTIEPLVKVKMFDVFGKMVFNKSINNEQIVELNLSDLSKGVYLLQLTLQNKLLEKKVVLSR